MCAENVLAQTPGRRVGGAAQLRALFERPGPVRIVGAHNALGARLAERAGFDGVWSSGLEVSASHALPDADILTMTELLEVARSMAAAVAVPVVADCDAGYGNANNVMHMIRRYEAAGIGHQLGECLVPLRTGHGVVLGPLAVVGQQCPCLIRAVRVLPLPGADARVRGQHERIVSHRGLAAPVSAVSVCLRTMAWPGAAQDRPRPECDSAGHQRSTRTRTPHRPGTAARPAVPGTTEASAVC
ncbi:hypothetical protein E6P78_31730 [Streptomyces sp. A0958]|uniref:isocitrate lyase/phosphoenolpyruvate mutase family protein n=1 Tax=Streptomyces sp. A0958 TaxID=2563101 RepID=UPI00109E9F25|nr:isocitrate lyase/phosphoenolpyruvate mutase family protein [Streptomyces sp. A0958]THA56784.1 hypothetical protein E6P78_31730 [Streptomyces sp. A0958]